MRVIRNNLASYIELLPRYTTSERQGTNILIREELADISASYQVSKRLSLEQMVNSFRALLPANMQILLLNKSLRNSSMQFFAVPASEICQWKEYLKPQTQDQISLDKHTIVARPSYWKKSFQYYFVMLMHEIGHLFQYNYNLELKNSFVVGHPMYELAHLFFEVENANNLILRGGLTSAEEKFNSRAVMQHVKSVSRSVLKNPECRKLQVLKMGSIK